MKAKKVLLRVIQLFLVVFFLLSIYGTIYLIGIISKSQEPEISIVINSYSSTILDSDGNDVATMNLVSNNSVSFDDLPDVFINSLISAEDARFFEHDGVDFQRILSAFYYNLTSSSLQGASTLTQQLIKNIYLDSSKTLERKLTEIVMALKLERKLTKEEIFTAYVNNIMFDGITLGVNNASLKLFSKPINNVNLPEAALLAGLVNAPSYYNPIKNPSNAKKRMNTVLDLMHRHGYINSNQLLDAKKAEISDLINISASQDKGYPYQSYLDIVYSEAISLTGSNPLTTPLIIETYLDSDLQSLIDKIENNEDSDISFTDDEQQLALAVIDNENGALIAAGGGRNYSGNFLFNRATDMRNQPASTIKPLLSYALAVEYLGWNSKQVVEDEPYTYPNTNISVNNVDYRYMGNILVEEAIGYSRNTTAISTLEKVIERVGVSTVTNYLSEINLLDVPSNEFNLSYALGAMQYGVSPVQMAAAYSMIARCGIYIAPYTIKRIISQKDGKVLYEHQMESKRVLSEDSAYILNDILKSVVDNNYYNLGSVKIKNVEMHAKTGTSSFDSTLLKELNYPSNASKDIWFAGYSADYSCVVWSGFDYPNKDKPNYFKASGDERKYIPRKSFAKIMNYQAIKGRQINVPESLSKVNIVKGTNLLPDEYTPNSYIISSYYKKGYEPTNKISPPTLDDIEGLSILIIGTKMNINFKDNVFDIVDFDKEKSRFDFSKIYGDITYIVEISSSSNSYVYSSNNPSLSFDVNDYGLLKIKAYTKYANVENMISNIYETEYYNFYNF